MIIIVTLWTKLTFEQIAINKKKIGEKTKLLKENLEVN